MTFDIAYSKVLGHEGEYSNDLADKLLLVLEKAHEDSIRAATSFYLEPKNIRQYCCTVLTCDRKVYATGLCNGHYLRKKKGQPMDGLLRIRKRHDKCQDCGKICNSKGGWGRCSACYSKERYRTIKGALVKAMGGSCGVCGIVGPLAIYDFHHIGNKLDSPSYLLKNASFSVIAKEIAKCVLLCANCHRIEHNQ